MTEPIPQHERLDVASMSARDAYVLLTDVVAPRPIAWVSTLDEDGRANLAPFSYYQAVCSSPPMVTLAIASRSDGTPKDTLANILARRELTISHVAEPLLDAMNATSADLPPHVDEWEVAGEPGGRLPSVPSSTVAPPRVAKARAALECRMVRAIPLGQAKGGGPSTTLVIAEVQCFWVAPGLLRRDDRGHLRSIPAAALASVGRLGGMSYARTTDVVELTRPKTPSR